MKNIRRAFIALFAFLIPLSAGAATGRRLQINQRLSSAHFSIAHVFVEKVDGSVPISSGTVILHEHSAVPEQVDAQLDPKHVKTDEPDRDRALAGPEYFDAEEYPQWTFHSTKIKAAGPNSFDMTGDFTLHGVTREIHLKVTIGGTPAHPEYDAAGTINRQLYGMKGGRLDPVIGDTAAVTLHIVLDDAR